MIIKRLLLVAFVMLAGYLAIDSVVPNGDMILAERTLQVWASIVVIYAYWPDGMDALRAQVPEKGDYLIIGIIMGQVASVFQATFVIVYRLAGFPAWLASADVNGIWILIAISASVLHVLAPGAIEGRHGMIPRRNRVGLGVGFGAAVATALAILITRPDLAGSVELLRPYLDDWFGTNASLRHLIIGALA